MEEKILCGEKMVPAACLSLHASCKEKFEVKNCEEMQQMLMRNITPNTAHTTARIVTNVLSLIPDDGAMALDEATLDEMQLSSVNSRIYWADGMNSICNYQMYWCSQYGIQSRQNHRQHGGTSQL